MKNLLAVFAMVLVVANGWSQGTAPQENPKSQKEVPSITKSDDQKQPKVAENGNLQVPSGEQIWASFWFSMICPLVGGGLAGAIVSLFFSRLLDAVRLWRLSTNLTLAVEPFPGGYRIRVFNACTHNIEDAIGLLSLTYDKHNDILNPSPHLCFIGPHHRQELKDDSLNWAMAPLQGHSHMINIYPGMKGPLNVVHITASFIEIASEQGFGSAGGGIHSRVFLTPKAYSGTLYIVAKNMLCRRFDIVIDPAQPPNEQVKITPWQADMSYRLLLTLLSWGKLASK